MKFTEEQQNRYASAGQVLVPKGENRAMVEEILQANSCYVPRFAGRCLHRRR